MILDHIENADRYAAMHPGFAKAFAFLRQKGLDQFKEGRRDIDGDRLYALAFQADGRPKKDALLEGHRRYIDVQYLVSGQDSMGWRAGQDCTTIRKDYDPAGDAILWSNPPTAWVEVPPKHFVIFSPDDAHAPGCGSGRMHKIVVKVAVQ